MKVVRAADVLPMVQAKGATAAVDGKALRPLDMAQMRRRAAASTPPADDTQQALLKAAEALGAQQQALVGLIAQTLVQVRESSKQEGKPIRAWEFEIERDDSEFKRMTRIRARAIR